MKSNRLWTILVLMLVTGCHRHTRGVTSVPPAAPPVAAVAPLPPALTQAESAFEAGDYLRAAVSYEFYFQARPQSNEMDRIRFRFGVAQSLSGVSGLEAASTDTFKQLIHDFPESSYVGPARMALDLQGNIVRLQADKASRDDRIQKLMALIPPAAPVLPAALAEAEAAYSRGDFSKAATAYETYLQSSPQAAGLDGILFRCAVSQSFSGVPARELASNDTFKRVIRDFSTGPYAPSASRIITFRENAARSQQSELRKKDDAIRQLTDELNNIKKVDTERRRTP
jgi:outer membrane protein assembly factor BamD (BamD/ComL family)